MVKKRAKPKGWRKEPVRHGLAAKGIKTGQKLGPVRIGELSPPRLGELNPKEEMSMAEMDKKNLMFWAGKNRTFYLRKYPDPGKFEGGFAIDPYVYEMTMDADVIGEVEFGSASAYTTMGKDALEFMEDAARGDGETLTKDEKAFILNMAGVIATEDNFGFVDVEYFESKKEFDQAILAIEEEWDAFYAGEMEAEEF